MRARVRREQMYPATAAAVVPVYNLAELGNNTLVLDRSVLPKIFLGDIFLWNDTQILDLQDATTRALLLSLEDQLIKPVVRDDGSGTTAIFTKALNLFSPSTDGPLSFGARIGADDVVDWCGTAPSGALARPCRTHRPPRAR